jgi:hypothetical protein
MRLCFAIERTEQHEAPLTRTRYCTGTYLTKNPRDVMNVGTRLSLDPRFGVICLARDPRDVLVSKHGEKPDAYWDWTSIACYRERWAVARKLVTYPRFLLLKFEDLIAHPDDVQQQVAARFPYLVGSGRFSEFHQRGKISEGSRKALNGVRPIDPANVGKWPDHLDRLRSQMHKDGPIDDLLIELGYEADSSWLERYGLQQPTTPRAPERPHRHGVAVTASAWANAAFARLHLPLG